MYAENSASSFHLAGNVINDFLALDLRETGDPNINKVTLNILPTRSPNIIIL